MLAVAKLSNILLNETQSKHRKWLAYVIKAAMLSHVLQGQSQVAMGIYANYKTNFPELSRDLATRLIKAHAEKFMHNAAIAARK
jgi:hypothetical protein